MVWQDATSYARGERGRVEPRTWEAMAGDYAITVTRYLGYPGWFFGLNRGSTYELGDIPLEDAKAKAIGRARVMLERERDKVNAALAALG